MIRKYMRYSIIVLIAACLCFISACSADKAEELFDNAQFEELQNNREHAEQLYKEIVEDYPESEAADKARERLEELREP